MLLDSGNINNINIRHVSRDAPNPLGEPSREIVGPDPNLVAHLEDQNTTLGSYRNPPGTPSVTSDPQSGVVPPGSMFDFFRDLIISPFTSRPNQTTSHADRAPSGSGGGSTRSSRESQRGSGGGSSSRSRRGSGGGKATPSKKKGKPATGSTSGSSKSGSTSGSNKSGSTSGGTSTTSTGLSPSVETLGGLIDLDAVNNGESSFGSSYIKAAKAILQAVLALMIRGVLNNNPFSNIAKLLTAKSLIEVAKTLSEAGMTDEVVNNSPILRHEALLVDTQASGLRGIFETAIQYWNQVAQANKQIEKDSQQLAQRA